MNRFLSLFCLPYFPFINPDLLGLLYVSGNLPTHPFPRPTFCPKWEASGNVDGSPYFCVFKYARAVKPKVWNEAENKERDWEETLKILFLSRAYEAGAFRARKTLTPRFTNFFSDFEKKKPVLQSSANVVGLGEG